MPGTVLGAGDTAVTVTHSLCPHGLYSPEEKPTLNKGLLGHRCCESPGQGNVT